jgi:hypothetical protein
MASSRRRMNAPLISAGAGRYCRMKNATPLATFNSRSPAESLQSRLIENGIAARINTAPKLEAFWFISRTRFGVRIEVPADQFEQAHRLLLQWDAAEEILRDAIHCPECKSLRVIYPQYTRRSLIPNLVVGTLAALGHEQEYYCEDCHYTWPKEGTHPARLRHHMAPYYFIDDVEPRVTKLPPAADRGPAS